MRSSSISIYTRLEDNVDVVLNSVLEEFKKIKQYPTLIII
jgi:hypothetical protein